MSLSSAYWLRALLSSSVKVTVQSFFLSQLWGKPVQNQINILF